MDSNSAAKKIQNSWRRFNAARLHKLYKEEIEFDEMVRRAEEEYYELWSSPKKCILCGNDCYWDDWYDSNGICSPYCKGRK